MGEDRGALMGMPPVGGVGSRGHRGKHRKNFARGGRNGGIGGGRSLQCRIHNKHERLVGIISGAAAKSRASLRRVLQHYEQLRLVCHLKVVSTQADIIE